MANWGVDGVDIVPAPLRRPCASCGRATQYLDELNLCDVCRVEHDADMAAIDKLEREDWERYMREMYRPR